MNSSSLIFALMNKRNQLLTTFFLVSLLVILFCADVGTGSVPISFAGIFRNIFGDDGSTIHTILWQFRLPKAITCTLAGASLAIGGLLMQTLFRNPLAGPDVLGLSSGASLAVGALVLTGRGLNFSSGEWSLAVAAGGGSILVLLLMLAVARSVRDNASLLIIGLKIGRASCRERV